RQGGGDALRLELPRVHWVRPEMAVEVTYLTWAERGLLRTVSYYGQREDKPARDVVSLPTDPGPPPLTAAAACPPRAAPPRPRPTCAARRDRRSGGRRSAGRRAGPRG